MLTENYASAFPAASDVPGAPPASGAPLVYQSQLNHGFSKRALDAVRF